MFDSIAHIIICAYDVNVIGKKGHNNNRIEKRKKNELFCGGKVELTTIVVNRVLTAIFTLWLVRVYFDVVYLEIDSCVCATVFLYTRT